MEGGLGVTNLVEENKTVLLRLNWDFEFGLSFWEEWRGIYPFGSSSIVWNNLKNLWFFLSA